MASHQTAALFASWLASRQSESCHKRGRETEGGRTRARAAAPILLPGARREPAVQASSRDIVHIATTSIIRANRAWWRGIRIATSESKNMEASYMTWRGAMGWAWAGEGGHWEEEDTVDSVGYYGAQTNIMFGVKKANWLAATFASSLAILFGIWHGISGGGRMTWKKNGILVATAV